MARTVPGCKCLFILHVSVLVFSSVMIRNAAGILMKRPCDEFSALEEFRPQFNIFGIRMGFRLAGKGNFVHTVSTGHHFFTLS